MASLKRTGAQIAQEYEVKKLAARSTLFEHGEITDAQTDQGFILRLNALVHARRHADANKVPKDLTGAIHDGKVKPAAELVLFGQWLLVDGRPGLDKTRGKQPNYHEIAKCVAACLFEFHRRERNRHHDAKTINGFSNGHTTGTERRKRARRSRKTNLTKHDLSDCWTRIFGVERGPEAFDAKLKSMRRLLSAYLEYLKARNIVRGGRTVTKSPDIQAVLEAISGKQATQSAQPKSSSPVTSAPAKPSAFEIPLCYSSSREKSESRGADGLSVQSAELTYECVPPSSTSSSRKVHPSLDRKIVLAPKVDIRRDYKVKALIDRIAILVSTTDKREEKKLNKQIETVTGRSVLVRDLTKPRKSDAWGKPLPVPDRSKSTGYHFAILIQDPAPEMLAAILTAIRDGPGIEGPVTFHMVEVSVDFYPKTNDPQEAILRRERMVGAIQRHHWTPHAEFMDEDIVNLRHMDARQIYRDPEKPAEEGKPKIRYLFSHEKSQSLAKIPDCRIEIPDIRQRILTDQPGEPLYLNSTVAKGDRRNAFSHVTIQHKVADQRNHEKQTKTVLPNHERRARVEVTLSGSDTLKDRGLDTIDDLGKVSFRRLTKPFLSFSLGTTDSWQHLLDDAQAQMHTRGVYGLELRHRARTLEERERLCAPGQTLPRNQDREGLGLVAWQEMNEVIGKAQDELTRRWRRFSRR